MRRPSLETKRIRKYGTGVGADYQPYIHIQDFNSRGTSVVIPDWKTKRGIHCLSQGEMYWYYTLRWDDNNVDIREQYPLNRSDTDAIANTYGLKTPGKKDCLMTTDFLVTEANGKLHTYSVKPNRDLSSRTIEKLFIEKMYWTKRNVHFTLLYKSDANLILVNNLRIVMEYYDKSSVFDEWTQIKHMIATKQLPYDMETIPITNLNDYMKWRKNYGR